MAKSTCWRRLAAVIVAGAALSVHSSVRLRGQNRDQAAINGLARRARTAGRVRVIVGVDAPFLPEGRLGDATAIAAQRASIASAQGRALARLSSVPVSVVRRFESIPFLTVEADAAGFDLLQRVPEVTTIEEDIPVPLALSESVPLVNGPRLWSAGVTGAGWTVAILDSGVDKAHPFLAGKVVSEGCYSSNVTGQSTSLCPGGVASSTLPDSGLNCPTNITGCTHGTHVAGIAAGKGPAFSGMARDASLITIQVFSYFPKDTSVLAWTSDIIAGLQRVFALKDAMRIAAVNLSLGGGAFPDPASCDRADPAIKAAIDQLRSVNIATVIASGNGGSIDALSSPACISSAISVGSTDDGSAGTTADALSPFSNSAPFLSLLAPGRWITSSVPGGGFDTLQGTSMATPHVTGAWALLKSADPSASVSQILSTLQLTGTPVADNRNGAAGVTRPRIKLDEALNFLLNLHVWASAASSTPTVSTAADYDGDGTDDMAVYRSSNGTWVIRRSSDLTSPNLLWGSPVLQDRPVPADYDGDGKTDVAVYRQTTGEWFIRASSTSSLLQLNWGAPTLSDLPVPADYDGDGKADLAVYRSSTGEWFVRESATDTMLQAGWGSPLLGDVPVPADYDGDGRADIAVYRGSTGEWFIRQSATETPFQTSWGSPALGDVPVPADYDGDGKADMGVYREATGEWLIRLSATISPLAVSWGAPALSDMPIPADYDGDGISDIAVYRYLTGEWFIHRSSDNGLALIVLGNPRLGDSVRRF